MRAVVLGRGGYAGLIAGGGAALWLATLGLAGCRSGGTDEPERARPPAARAAPAPRAAGFNFPLAPASPTGLTIEAALGGKLFERPVFLTAAPGDPDAVYVVEQAGVVHRVELTGSAASKRVLDHRRAVRTQHDEEGLLGLAFSPTFGAAGDPGAQRWVYLNYSASKPRRTQLTRMRVGPDGRFDPRSEEPLLGVPQPYGNHNGGTLLFGPDGDLYLGVGDGGAAHDPHRNGQNLGTLLGSMLRLRVRDQHPGYSIPPDNPFVQRAGARPEIWAYGLRNPWRCSFDRARGDLWCGDVGQNEIEEVDRIVRGGNFGWNAREGTRRFEKETASPTPPDAIEPIAEYGRAEGESITGGVVYRGSRLADLRGLYVFGDYVTGTVWAIDPTGPHPGRRTVLARVPSLASFGEDAHGELYALSFDGHVYRFTPADPEVAQREFPTRLSQTGLFADLRTLEPASGLLPYAVTHPFWSDGAEKKRWIAVPEGTQTSTPATGPWTFPEGTVTVKHFELPLDDAAPTQVRRLETRVMVHERGGWAGYSYRWNDAQTDANLIPAPAEATFTVQRAGKAEVVRWAYPAGTDCLRCHTRGYGEVMGVRARQLHASTQTLAALADRGVVPPTNTSPFPAVDDPSASTEQRARAYLDVNCAPCHHPGGPAPGDMDLRAETERASMHLWDVEPEAAVGIEGERRLSPGAHAKSSIWLRASRRGEHAMPPLASHRVDVAGAELLAAWIDEPSARRSTTR